MKHRFLQITDADEAAALQANGKYRDSKPYWILRAGQLWVLVNDAWRAWRSARTSAGDA